MPVGSCQLLGRCLLLRLVLLGRSICPTADMLMRVNEIKQSQRELLIGIGGGECTTADKGECQDGAVEGARGGRGEVCAGEGKCQTLNLANNAHLSAQHAQHVHVS